ncbi:MAG TPA: hypothetical protein VFS29_04325, partial [Motilibacteraceae bacterium]|nr:hypothetical protein [Motilibacteraceae bacterium]
MRHPSEGTIRRLADEPVGVADDERAHIAQCAACLAGLAEARRDAALVGAVLDVPATADVDAAWARLAAASGSAPVTSPVSQRRRRRWLHSPAVAAVGVAALLAGGGVAAAADWLPVFHTERIAPVRVSEADLVKLPDLSGYGDLTVERQPELHQVADVAAAARETGLDVPEVTALPHGVSSTPQVQVGGKVSALFTFSAAKAEATAGTLPPLPAGLDGAKVRLTAGPGVAEVWSEGRGMPALVVGRAVAPTATSSGVPFSTLRDYLLSLPGLPPELAAQLRTVSADGTALPLPVPADQVSTSTADV